MLKSRWDILCPTDAGARLCDHAGPLHPEVWGENGRTDLHPGPAGGGVLVRGHTGSSGYVISAIAQCIGTCMSNKRPTQQRI